jgi:hypothetical protein
MTNDELLQKLIAHLELNLETLIEDTEDEETESGEERDEFTRGYISGLRFAISQVAFIQDGTTELK